MKLKKNLTGHIWKPVTFGKNQLVILKTDEVKLQSHSYLAYALEYASGQSLKMGNLTIF